MLTTAGLGVAFNAKPAPREIADTALSQSSMEAILFVLGISDDVVEHYGRVNEPELSTAVASERWHQGSMVVSPVSQGSASLVVEPSAVPDDRL